MLLADPQAQNKIDKHRHEIFKIQNKDYILYQFILLLTLVDCENFPSTLIVIYNFQLYHAKMYNEI